LIHWVDHLTDWVIEFYTLFHMNFTCFRLWFSVIYLIEVLIITSFSSFLNTSSLDLLKQKYIIIFLFLIIMSFNNYLCTIKKINTLNHFLIIFCHYCFFHLCSCIIMNDYKKCAECTCCECFCVDVSWKTLNRIHDKLKLNILKMKFKQSQLLSEQICVAAKLNCFCKTLQQINDHAKKKTICLLQKLFNKKKIINDSTSKILSQLLNTMSVNFWQFIFLFFSQNTEVFLHSF